MNEATPPPGSDRVPTLTEVLELHGDTLAEAPLEGALQGPLEGPLEEPQEEPQEGPREEPPALPRAEPLPAAVAPVVHDAPPLDTSALVGEVLAEIQPRLDMLFESRLRDALAPALARAAQGLIGEARDELGAALRELVDDAVKRALQRRGKAR